MTDALITDLAQVSSLRVISRTLLPMRADLHLQPPAAIVVHLALIFRAPSGMGGGTVT